MKQLTANTYRKDTLYPRVSRAVAELLREGQLVSAPAVMVKMQILSKENLEAWRVGKVPYLERVVVSGLGKTSRILRILRFLSLDQGLPLASPHAAGNIKYKGRLLRFSKSGDAGVEQAYKWVYGSRVKRTKAEAETSNHEAVERSDAPDGALS